MGDQRTLHERWLAWPQAKQKRFWQQLTPAQKEQFRAKTLWRVMARPAQYLPEGEHWAYWLVMAGRGFGKTRTGAETVRLWARSNKIVNIAGPTAADVRDVMVEGVAGILAICPREERPRYEPSKRRLTWPNGCITTTLSADEPERFRGPQCYKFWADELAAWKYEESWDLAMFGLRLGNAPQALITTTPKPTNVIRELIKNPRCVVTRGSTYDNRANLAETYFTNIITKYEGTRLGRQELNAELLDDNPLALWQRAQIDALRVSVLPPDIRRVVIGVDPAVSSNADSDETGIVGVAIDNRYPPHFYVVDDATKQYTPEGWAEAVVAMLRRLRADRVVGEVNNGGDLVEANLRTKDALLPFRAVHASRGKTARAEPVAALYEQGRVHHYGSYAALEDEMCDWDPSLPTDKQKSPNRMDALVWAIWELGDLGKPEPVQERVVYEEPGAIDSLLDEWDLREQLNAW